MKTTEKKRVAVQCSRARMAGQSASLSLQDWEQTIADFNGLCAYCLAAPFVLLEHFLPIEVAGTNVNNCVPACLACNRKKRDYQGETLIERLGRETVERIQSYLASRRALPQAAKPDRPKCPPSKVLESMQLEEQPIIDDEKEYYTLDEAAAAIGIKRATIYNYLDDLSIKPHKFGRDRKAYLSREEVQKLKDYKDRPWRYQRSEKKEEQAA